MFVNLYEGKLVWRAFEAPPDGKLFSLRAVFDAIPAILKTLPVTLSFVGRWVGHFLALSWPWFSQWSRLTRIYILFSLRASSVGPFWFRAHVDLFFGIPLLLKAINQKYGTSFLISMPFLPQFIIAFAFNEAAYASETIRAAILQWTRWWGVSQSGYDKVYLVGHHSNVAVVATPTLDQLPRFNQGNISTFSGRR